MITYIFTYLHIYMHIHCTSDIISLTSDKTVIEFGIDVIRGYPLILVMKSRPWSLAEIGMRILALRTLERKACIA
jgi:hypothetical protein